MLEKLEQLKLAGPLPEGIKWCEASLKGVLGIFIQLGRNPKHKVWEVQALCFANSDNSIFPRIMSQIISFNQFALTFSACSTLLWTL